MGACASGEAGLGVDIALENAQPSDDEAKVYNTVNEVLEQRSRVLKVIEDYKGCQELARAAMSNPSHETEKAAFEGLLVAVESISEFFAYSKRLDSVFAVLLNKLAETVTADRTFCHLEKQQALARQLADIFDFALDFDRIRMLRPNLSNDFSYYRRLLPKFNKHPGIRVKDDEASGMALFTAEHIPMTSCLAKSATHAYGQNDAVAVVLSSMANSCVGMLKKKSVSGALALLCARGMTGAVVIFDHVHPAGAFHKRTPLQIKLIITTLKKDFASETSLLNAIRYSSKTFRDAPEPVQQLFD